MQLALTYIMPLKWPLLLNRPGHPDRFILTTWAFQPVSDVSCLLPHPLRSGEVLGLLSLAYLFLLHALTLLPPHTLALSAAPTCSP